MRNTLIPLALLAASALPAAAQGVSDGAVIAAPQYVSYKFGGGAAEKTVNQLSVPFAVILPFGDRFNVDVSGAYANSTVKTAGVQTSSINGLTDTQIRGNLTIGDNAAIFTIGLNLPTGRYTVPAGQQEAAGQIGNDFLVYPISSMGSGLAATGGVAFAQSMGTWNLGLGASFRHSTKFDAYQVASSVLRFTPGDEYRLRVGVDRPVGDGQFTAGVTYSRFGNDAADSTTFATGDRALAQASLFLPVTSGDLSVTAWNLYRASGQLIGGQSPWENVANLNVGFGLRAGDLYIQPSIEGRAWNVKGTKAGMLGNVGVRLRYNAGIFSFNPSATYSVGSLYPKDGGASTDLTGYKLSLLVRLH